MFLFGRQGMNTKQLFALELARAAAAHQIFSSMVKLWPNLNLCIGADMGCCCCAAPRWTAVQRRGRPNLRRRQHLSSVPDDSAVEGPLKAPTMRPECAPSRPRWTTVMTPQCRECRVPLPYVRARRNRT
eukprot:365486-Chlamydomonas_euryale.AAC.10